MWIRRDAPATLMLPGFVFGQISPIYGLFVGALAAWGARWYVVAGILLGVASSPLTHSDSDIAVPSGERTYLVNILALDYPRVGEVQFVARVLAVKSANDDPRKALMQPLAQPFNARIRTVHLPWRNSALLFEGARVAVRVALVPVEDRSRPWSFDAHLARHGVLAVGTADLVTQILSAPRSQESASAPLESRYASEAHGVLWSLATGSRNVVSQETERVFRRLGLSHVLVFSGFQVMLIGGLVAALTKRLITRFFIGIRGDVVGAIAGFAASLALTRMSGWEPSGVRALFALGYLFSTSLLVGASGSAIQRLAVGVIGVSLVFPGAIFEPGVQLTFAALLGLLCSPIRGWFVPAVSATIFTSWVGLIWFGEWTPVALILNPLVAPLLTVTGCLLALPVLMIEQVTRGLSILHVYADAAVEILGHCNLAIIHALGGLVPSTALLKIEGNALWATLVSLGALIFTLLVNATMRYLMRNGVAFRTPPWSI